MTSVMAVGFVVSVLAAPAPAPASGDVVMRAMRDELGRTMEKLQLQSLDRPYFVA